MEKEENQNNFTKDKFVNKIQQLNLKHPHIAYAQAMLESGNFTFSYFTEHGTTLDPPDS